LAAFSDSACLPSACSFETSATSSFAWDAAASKRFAVVSLICFTSFGHWNPSAGVANRSPFECQNFVRIENGKFVGVYDGGGEKPWLCFDGKKPVGLSLNGFGDWEGKPTIYDAGTAVLPA